MKAKKNKYFYSKDFRLKCLFFKLLNHSQTETTLSSLIDLISARAKKMYITLHHCGDTNHLPCRSVCNFLFLEKVWGKEEGCGCFTSVKSC